MPTYTPNDDGSISKVETLTTDEVAQQIAEHQAAIDGAEASKKAYVEAKDLEIATHQAAIAILQPVFDEAKTTLDVLVADLASADPLIP